MYELLTPLQALGFAAWANFLFVGLYPTSIYSPNAAQETSLAVNAMVFACLGLVLLRNRDRARRRLRELGAQGLSWLEAFWPAPYILIGAIGTGFLPLLITPHHRIPIAVQQSPNSTLEISLFLFRLLFFALWICRDLLYLQWMNLRPGRKPLLRAIMFALVYYTTLFGLFFSHGSTTVKPEEAAFQAIFVPARALTLEAASWNSASGAWLIALLSQVALMFLFAFLNRQELQALAARPKAYPSAIPPVTRPGSPAVAS